jgi:hypothetical protein
MNDASASPSVEAQASPSRQQKKFLLLVTFALATHLALIFLFGSTKNNSPRPVTNVPQLQLANAGDELIELDNPALFALPNARDFSSTIWQKNKDVAQPSFRYREEPRWLPLAPENLGAAFGRFMQTNRFGIFHNDFKPSPQFAVLTSGSDPAFPQRTTLEISGTLAARKLLSVPALPTLPLNDVIAPSKVQVLVDKSGNVLSTVLLPLENFSETINYTERGDTNAVAIARSLRFAPAPQPTLGEIIFRWHTVPLTTTNAP